MYGIVLYLNGTVCVLTSAHGSQLDEIAVVKPDLIIHLTFKGGLNSDFCFSVSLDLTDEYVFISTVVNIP